jgi:hypothetical protein
MESLQNLFEVYSACKPNGVYCVAPASWSASAFRRFWRMAQKAAYFFRLSSDREIRLGRD